MDVHHYYVTAPLVQLKKLSAALVETMTGFCYNAGLTIEIRTTQELPEKVLHEIDLIKIVCPKTQQKFNIEHLVSEE